RAELLEALASIHRVFASDHLAIVVQRQVTNAGVGWGPVQLVVHVELDLAVLLLVGAEAVRDARHLVVADDVAGGQDRVARHMWHGGNQPRRLRGIEGATATTAPRGRQGADRQ